MKNIWDQHWLCTGCVLLFTDWKESLLNDGALHSASIGEHTDPLEEANFWQLILSVPSQKVTA